MLATIAGESEGCKLTDCGTLQLVGIETVIIAILVLVLLAILLNLVPRITENQKLIIFVVLVMLTLLVVMRGYLKF